MRVHLFVPSDSAKLDNATASGADALWLQGASVPNALPGMRERMPDKKLYVRLGALEDSFDSDLDAAMAVAPDGIVLPAHAGADVQHLGVKLAVREAELGLADGATRIIALVAAPGAILHLGSFANASSRLAGLAFDVQGFAAALGNEDTQAAPAILARTLTLLAAKAASIAAILVGAPDSDLPLICQAAKRDGFDAVVVRDPADIAAVRASLK